MIAPHALRIALLLSLFAGGCHRSKPEPPTPPPPPVEVAIAERGEIPIHRDYPGTLVSVRTVELSARVEGWLLRQEIPDGAMVKPGDVVYRIDPAPFVVALDQATADLAVAEAQYANAMQKYERNKPLVKVDAVSAETFESLEAQYLAAKASVEARKAAVEQAALNLSYCTIPSSAAGQLSKSLVFEGTLVTPGVNATLNNVRQLDPLWAEFQPISDDIPALHALMKEGSASTPISLPPSATVPWTTNGKVVFIDNAVGSRSATITARLEFANPKFEVLPGTYVNVRLRTGTLENAVSVPEQAIVYQSAQPTIWVVDADDKVRLVTLETGPRGGAGIVVMQGLQGGERVVRSGQQRLKAGEHVRVVTAPAAAPAAAPATRPGAPAAAPAAAPTAAPTAGRR